MDFLQGLIQAAPQLWKGARRIRIEQGPDQFPGTLASDILDRCDQEALSPELVLYTSQDADPVFCADLIVRCSAQFPYEVQDHLNYGSDLVVQRLKAAGFKASCVREEEAAASFASLYLGGRQPAAECGFCPIEAEVKDPAAYVPGSYVLSGGSRISTGSIAEILAAYPGAMISIALHRTQLYPGELAQIGRASCRE